MKQATTPKPSNSTRIPEPLQAFVSWISDQRKWGEKTAEVFRLCLKLGAQMYATEHAHLIDERGRLGGIPARDIAADLQGMVRQAARFCEQFGYPIIELPASDRHHIEKLENQVAQLLEQLARMEHMIVQTGQAGLQNQSRGTSQHALLNHSSLVSQQITEEIDTTEEAARRLSISSLGASL